MALTALFLVLVWSICSLGVPAEGHSSELRLVGGASRCAGTVEIRHGGEWRRMRPFGPWDLEDTAAVCRDLSCGSAVTQEYRYDFPLSLVLWIRPGCVKTSSVRGCVDGSPSTSPSGLNVKCLDFLLKRPIISVSMSFGTSEVRPLGMWVELGSNFRVQCSVEPQYPGGCFQLLSPIAPHPHTLPAVHHSAHFLFSNTGYGHEGNYACVYLVEVSNHSLSSQSSNLQLSVGRKTSVGGTSSYRLSGGSPVLVLVLVMAMALV